MRYFFLGVLLLVTGCTLVGEEFKLPEFGMESLWQDEVKGHIADEQSVVMSDRWWENFNDPQLTALIDKSLVHNRDIKIAAANLERARALRLEARSFLFPGAQIRSEAVRQGLNRTTTGDINASVRERNNFNNTLDASWELDIIGGVRRGLDAATAEVGAREASLADMQLAITAEVAQSYFTARSLAEQITVSQHNIALLTELETLTEAKLQSGDISSFDTHRVRAERQSIQASLPGLEADLYATRQRLHVLTADQASDALPVIDDKTPMAELEKRIPLGLPSDLLKRRPDVRIALHNLEADTARIGVQEAELFPHFSLIGAPTANAFYFSDVFTGDAIGYRWGGLIEWNILQLPTILSRIEAAEAQRDATRAAYEKAVLEALEDVHASLMRYGKGWEQLVLLRETKNSREEAAKIARLRYEAGQDEFLNVIDAERSLADSRLRQVQAESELRNQLVQLFKALGGGVIQSAPPPAEPINSPEKK